ncbi:MAG: putative lipid II flippase FtsW [Coriobacteriia bacterium]|nr:putative lipid II flippase FtsW [Actinomycetota bacterium]MDZ4166270.1 putative lipid II flippase FtsW [Coriobacteriia bacterium]
MTASRRQSLTSPAYIMLIAVALLVAGGVVMVYSASAVSDYVKFGDSAYHAKRQAIYALGGIVALAVASRWDFRTGRKAVPMMRPATVAWAVWGASLAGLVAVDIAGVGKWGATRSIDLGPVFIQPSEFAKVGCLLVVASLIVQWRRQTITGGQFAFRVSAALLPVVVLIMLQPDMGTTMSIVAVTAVMLWLGGLRARWFAAMLAAGLPTVALLIWKAGYRMERITGFLDPWADPADSGYQIIQSLYAFGSGGLFGVGLGLSRQKFFYLPAAHNDFIFAIIGEETGLVGTLCVVAAFAAFAYAGTRIAIECKDPFGRLMAGGLTSMIVIQALMNMAAVTRLMPITGIPLPFVSAGGSSLVLTLASVGLILAVSRHSGGARVKLVRKTTSRGSARASSGERGRDSRSHLPGADSGRPATRRGA